MEILREIENVDHNNPHAMFRLNELVYKWLLTVNPSTPYGKFVFSRDALKAIRPKGWYFSMSQTAGQIGYRGALFFFGWCENPPSDRPSRENASPKLPTEELAELHAIIQAIDYERGRE